MKRYYFHLYNDETCRDEERVVLVNDAAALQYAANCARTMAAESVQNGRLTLDHRIEVETDGGKIGTVRFRDVVEIH